MLGILRIKMHCSIYVGSSVIELDAVSFENLLQRPMDDQPQITAHKSLMRCEEGVEHCVLFLGEGSQDGVLVNSEG